MTAPPPIPRPPVIKNRAAPVDMQLLADLPSLALRSRCLLDGFLSGRHRSARKGSSVEFAEYRAYQLGDDLRRVDWRLFGRSDRMHVKQFEDEAQLRVFTVLDASASMDFSSRQGAWSKLDFARLALAGVATLAQRQGDAFGLGIAASELVDFLRARSTSSHWQTFISRLQSISPQPQTALAASLQSLAEILPKRSLVVIASDFYEELPALGSVLNRLQYDGHDLIGLHVLDPIEVDFDVDNAGIWVDAESGARQRLDSDAAREGYLRRFREFCVNVEEKFRNAGGDFVQLRTDQLPIPALASYIAARKARTR